MKINLSNRNHYIRIYTRGRNLFVHSATYPNLNILIFIIQTHTIIIYPYQTCENFPLGVPNYLSTSNI